MFRFDGVPKGALTQLVRSQSLARDKKTRQPVHRDGVTLSQELATPLNIQQPFAQLVDADGRQRQRGGAGFWRKPLHQPPTP